MTRITLNHPVFRSAGYDSDDQTMEVSFCDGSVLLYRGVPMSIYNKFMHASQRTDLNIDTYYRTNVEGKFPAREVKPARAIA